MRECVDAFRWQLLQGDADLGRLGIMAELKAINPFDKPKAWREGEVFEKLHSHADRFVVVNLAEVQRLVAELVGTHARNLLRSSGPSGVHRLARSSVLRDSRRGHFQQTNHR